MNSKEIIGMLHDGEHLAWSGQIHKINKRRNRQPRRFLLTNRRFFNLGYKSIVENILTFFTRKNQKRCINIKDIEQITYSRFSSEWVIHIPKEYDYRLSATIRDDIIYRLIFYREKLTDEPIKFFLVDDMELGKYTRNENETKEKLPNIKAILLDTEGFKNLHLKRKNDQQNNANNSETLFDHSRTVTPNEPQEQQAQKSLTEQDFHFVKTLGRGGFGKVCLLIRKDTNYPYAVKIIKKIEILQNDHMQKVRNEKDILIQNNHQFLIGLEFCFHSPERIYFGMKFLQGGELLSHIQSKGAFTEPQAKFYSAQILLALEYLHTRNIAYRDLKPENVVLDTNGYIKLIDYGICKTLVGHDSMTQTVVGSKEYLPPEVITQRGHNLMVDWWSFGILLYEMVCGDVPFRSEDNAKLLTSIVKSDFGFPVGLNLSVDCMDLIAKLLTKNPANRIGNKNDAQDIINHPWFRGFSFQSQLEFKLEAPIIPCVNSMVDYSNFNPFFTGIDPNNTEEIPKIPNFTSEFGDFDWCREDHL